MESSKKFLTKTGYCHVMKDKIVFTRRGFMGLIGDIAIEGRMRRILLFFAALSIFIFYFAYFNYMQGEALWAGMFAVIGAYLIYAVIKGLNHSVHPIIERKKITEVKFVKEVQDLTSALFEIKFQDAKGKMKKRIITLPFPRSKYESDVQLAVKIMREEGLIE